MRLFQFNYEGVYLGGVAIVIAHDADDARNALLAPSSTPKDWNEKVWHEAIASASVSEIAIPKFTAVIYNYDGDY